MIDAFEAMSEQQRQLLYGVATVSFLLGCFVGNSMWSVLQRICQGLMQLLIVGGLVAACWFFVVRGATAPSAVAPTATVAAPPSAAVYGTPGSAKSTSATPPPVVPAASTNAGPAPSGAWWE